MDYKTKIGKDVTIKESTIGKFTSIAWGARINPSNHPSYTRVA